MQLGLIKKILTFSFSTSAILLITAAIVSPKGLFYYEYNVTIKVIEAFLSLVVICLLYSDLVNAAKSSRPVEE